MAGDGDPKEEGKVADPSRTRRTALPIEPSGTRPALASTLWLIPSLLLPPLPDHASPRRSHRETERPPVRLKHGRCLIHSGWVPRLRIGRLKPFVQDGRSVSMDQFAI